MKLLKQPIYDPTLDSSRVIEESVAAVKRARLTIPQRPVNDQNEDINPKLPLDLAASTPDKLGKLLTQFTAMCDYTAYAAALADIDSTVEEHVLETVTARVRLEKSGTVSEKADKTSIDPRVRDAAQKYFERYALFKLTATLLSNYERDLSAVSREITRRGQEWDRGK